MSTERERLCLAWWNTGLAPPARRAGPPREQSVALAIDIARQLIDHEHVDLLALAEVTPELAARIRIGCESHARLRLAVDDRPLPTGRHLGIIYNADRMHVISERKLGDMWDGRFLSGGLHLELLALPSHQPLHVIAMHWYSKMIGDNAARRSALGFTLQKEVESLKGSVVLLGDFNDEPYNDALHSALLGTRDRNLVRRNSSRLYNPFWRHLGERQPMEQESEGRLPAGTYFGATSTTDWHTFDQALVSAPVLTGPGWVLLEEQTGIWQRPPLLTEKGRIKGDFDHFPIYVTFSFQPEVEDKE